MRDKKRQNSVTLSITQNIRNLIIDTFPKSYSPAKIAREIGCKEVTARKLLSRLVKDEKS